VLQAPVEFFGQENKNQEKAGKRQEGIYRAVHPASLILPGSGEETSAGCV
jgi:hypothetical protein